MSPSGAAVSTTSPLVVPPAFWQVVSKAARGPWVLLFELVQSLGYVIRGSVCEEHIDDLSQFATSSSRIQLLHHAAETGKEVRYGTAKLGLTLSCKSTLLANNKSLGKLIVGHLVADGVPICQGTVATDLVSKPQQGKEDAHPINGNASGKEGEEQREFIGCAGRTPLRQSSR